jgi:integrase
MTQKQSGRRLAGAIRKLPSGRYQARFRADDGRMHPAPETFRTKAEADRWLASVATDVARGDWVDPDAGKITLRNYSTQWMAGKADLAPKTVELYQYLLNRVILPGLGDVAMTTITPMRVRAWRADLLRAGKPGESTIAKAYRLLSGIMGTAVIDSVIIRSPCVEKGAGVEHAPEMRVGKPSDISALVVAMTPRYRALILTAAYAGCRWGELAGLRKPNLDMDGARLTVIEQAVELHGGVRIVCPPKTDAGRRVVHLPAALVDALREHIDQFVDDDPDGLVFTNSKGEPLRMNNFRKRHWLPAVRKAGLGGLRFHDLRHTAGTLATVSGATIREVQARLGHASPAAAYRYQHVLDDRDAQIAQQLDTVMRQAARSQA